MKVTKCIIKYYCPGTFFDENGSITVPERDFTIETAVARASEITARYNAKPYGFKFVVKTYEETESGGQICRSEPAFTRSGMHYLDGTVLTLADIPDTPENSTLRSNMQNQDLPAAVETRNGYRHTGALRREDVVLRGSQVVARGEDYY